MTFDPTQVRAAYYCLKAAEAHQAEVGVADKAARVRYNHRQKSEAVRAGEARNDEVVRDEAWSASSSTSSLWPASYSEDE